MVGWYVTKSYRPNRVPPHGTYIRDDFFVDDSTSIDPKERRIGVENRENIHQALSTLAIFPFTQRLGMSIQEVRALVTSACTDAANPALKAYFPL